MEPTVEGQLVSGRYFSTLGVHAVAGRTIGVEDDRIPNAHPVAMLSYGYWKRRFSLDPSILDKTISLCGTPFTVIGITPPEFFGVEVGVAPDIFVPVMMQPAVMPASENLLERPIIYAAWLRVLGRLRPGVPVQQAAAEMAVLFDQIEWPRDKSGFRIDKFGNRIDEKLVVDPGLQGADRLAPPVLPASVHPDGGRRRRDPDCVREHSKPLDGAGRGAPARVRAAGRTRSQSLAFDAATARGKRPAGNPGRRLRSSACELGHSTSGGIHFVRPNPGYAGPRARPSSPGIHGGSLLIDRHSLRTGPCDSCHPDRPCARLEESSQPPDGPRQLEARQDSRGIPGGAVVVVVDRRGSVRAQSPEAEQPGCRIPA